jgi:hypothetical protein
MDLFELENQMAPAVADWLRGQGFAVKQEFSLPWGICDLVGVKFNQKKVQKRISNGQMRAVGSSFRLHILSKIPDVDASGSSITLHELRRELAGSLPYDLLENEIAQLVRSKFVTSPARKRFQKVNGWAPLHTRIVAIELKLARTSEALAQARLNRAFSTESYVALPAPLAFRVVESRRAREFKDCGIGLLAVSRDVCARVLQSRLGSDSTDDVLQAHCVERFWRTRDKSS